ncbi:MAG: hypothetical protein WKF34_08135 [Pyrinomonadaceae bacterium]
MKLRWRFGIIAGLFLAIFSLYPQMKMIYLRGAEWNGNYAYNDVDEVAYGSYLKALIDGRPRKNDPYTGRDDTAENPQPESLFSIQFAGPYTVALPAALLGISATWAMTISGAIAAFLTALIIFWLVGMMTGDSLLAMAGSLIVLAGGAIFAGEGAIGEISGWSYAYPYFPGFRRYIPAMSFPAFFLFTGLVWKLIERPNQVETEVPSQRTFSQKSLLVCMLAAAAFTYTVFTYFYVWTTAAAWAGCLGLCILVFRPSGYIRDLKLLSAVGVGCLIGLLPYAHLLSKRSHTMDEVQLLVTTRAPDLLRVPELIGYLVLIVLGVGILARAVELRDRATLFAISLALTPVIVFNQQLVTGQSLQPIHYQVFIGNYVAGLALVITLGLIWPSLAKRGFPVKLASIGLAAAAAAWGFVECHYTVGLLDDVNIIRDEAYPVARRLAEIGRDDPGRHHRVVLHMGMAEADDLPTVAPQSVLWSRHQHVFAGVTWDEHKERYYQQLYYQGVDAKSLASSMKRGEDFVSVIALFGWGRHTDRLNLNYTPLSYAEIDIEASRYEAYATAFDASKAVQLDYLVASLDYRGFENVDIWYERDQGEVFGKYVVYKLAFRPPR